MYTRILGIILIIKWVAPFFLLGAALLLSYEVFLDVERFSKAPIAKVERAAERVKIDLGQTEILLENVRSNIVDLEMTIDNLPSLGVELPKVLDLPSIPFVPIPLTLYEVVPGTPKTFQLNGSVDVPDVSLGTTDACSTHLTFANAEACVTVPAITVKSTSSVVDLPEFSIPIVQITVDKDPLQIPNVTGLSLDLPVQFTALSEATKDLELVVGGEKTTFGNIDKFEAGAAKLRRDLVTLADDSAALVSTIATKEAGKWAIPVFAPAGCGRVVGRYLVCVQLS